MDKLSSFEVVTAILEDGQTLMAKEVAKIAREMGYDWTRENANSSLYRMLKNDLVIKIETEKAPLWTLPKHKEKFLQSRSTPDKNVISFEPKNLPLIADDNLTLQVLSIEIQFQFDPDLSSNDNYMSGDWLN